MMGDLLEEIDVGEVFEFEESRLGSFAKCRPAGFDYVVWRYRDAFGKHGEINLQLDECPNLDYFKRRVLQIIFGVKI